YCYFGLFACFLYPLECDQEKYFLPGWHLSETEYTIRIKIAKFGAERRQRRTTTHRRIFFYFPAALRLTSVCWSSGILSPSMLSKNKHHPLQVCDRAMETRGPELRG
ncbi:unnamed protein product, partial [Ectocarpus fasciculatus]